MNNADIFGRDPQIQYMRRIFAQMEKSQNGLLKHINMVPHDERLRRVRDVALKFFEKTWVAAQHKGIVENEEDAATLYLYCFSYALSTRGIRTPPQALPEHRAIEVFAKEVLK